MSDILKTFLSMSVSGSLLILGLLLLKPLFQNRLSRQWQYYVWLIVIVRLLLPVTLDVSLVGSMFQQIGQAVTQPAVRSAQNEEIFGEQRSRGDTLTEKTELLQDGNMYGDAKPLQDGGAQDKSFSAQSGNSSGNETVPGKDTVSPIFEYLWVLWLGGALVLLVRKVTAYQCFVRYIKADCEEVSDISLLDRLAQTSAFAGVRQPVELYVNHLASSPMLLGFFRPCIILPVIDLPGDELLCIFRHELTHYKHRDMLYKWLVQITICLHWFNPLVYLMSRELGRACEFSCDEAVIRSLDEQGRRIYGDTLLHAVKTGGEYRKPVISATLGESAELLKERLDAIMKFRKMSKRGCCVALLLSAVLIFGSVVSGAYAAEGDAAVVGVALTKAATQNKAVSLENTLPVSEDASGKTVEMETLEFKGTTYYLVFNEEQLRAIGTGEYGMDLNYMQQADIQLSEKEWVPIGTWENPFTGSFNGNGYEITGLTMKNPDADVVGMFGIAENAHIYNITLRDYDIMDAGKNVSGRSVAPILPVGMGGTRSYDNFVYPKETASPAQVIISPEDALPASVDASEEIAAGDVNGGKSDTLADKYYGINLPQFGAAFAMLDEDAQATWLERIYSDGKIAFFSVGLQQLDEGCPLVTLFAQKAYEDGQISFFSVLAGHMDKETLELWLDKAMQEKQVSFQSVLLKELDRDWELQALEEELRRQRLAEYERYGITRDGKAYYYQGQLVNIFLDHQTGAAFYTLDMNPNGTVNIKIIRGEDGVIQGADYMTKAEVEELLGNMYDPDDE